ncbi:four-carbon acid sugar kinase family protein [Microbacterium soli]|uniref:Four-carbon acid sugar kinase family protein n=2 Tax=Microbacterium soli TaxID=446075 RepID=A0ABP7NBZ4_9MICO
MSWTAASLATALREHRTVYLQTNARALERDRAVALLRETKQALAAVSARESFEIQIVLRGDSTLRGHIFAEIDALDEPEKPILLVPAFPAGGRITRGSMHYARQEDEWIPVAETEYARDPVFPVPTSHLADLVRNANRIVAATCSAHELRASGGDVVREALTNSPGGSFVIPDIETDDDLRLVQRAFDAARVEGRQSIVRCAAPLAAMIGGVYASELLHPSDVEFSGPTLIVCGSHTELADRQMAAISARLGLAARVVPVHAALADDERERRNIVTAVRADLRERGIALLITERGRKETHNTLRHGELVMSFLTSIVSRVASHAASIVTKGGITASEVIRVGLGAAEATVEGQVIPGVSVWRVETSSRAWMTTIVPGNVGETDTVATILRSLGVR